MQFAFVYTENIQNIFWKSIDFVKNLEMTQIVVGGEVMLFASLWRNAYENWCAIYTLKHEFVCRNSLANGYSDRNAAFILLVSN